MAGPQLGRCPKCNKVLLGCATPLAAAIVIALPCPRCTKRGELVAVLLRAQAAEGDDYAHILEAPGCRTARRQRG